MAVTLVPVGEGLLVVRRNIEPKKGHLCLPGGFMNDGESWQEACARELKEETSLIFRPSSITLFDVLSSSNNQHLLVFGLAPKLEGVNFEALEYDHEVSEVTLVHKNFEELAFPTHTEVAGRFFGSR